MGRVMKYIKRFEDSIDKFINAIELFKKYNATADKYASSKDVKYLGVPNICFSLNNPDDDRELKYSEQRKTRGFDDSETWSLCDTIARFILPRLKVFKQNKCGIPSSLDDEEWNTILQSMIDAFQIIDDDETHMFTDEQHDTIDKGLTLFKDYFLNLWW
jgi:hypothetical protein